MLIDLTVRIAPYEGDNDALDDLLEDLTEYIDQEKTVTDATVGSYRPGREVLLTLQVSMDTQDVLWAESAALSMFEDALDEFVPPAPGLTRSVVEFQVHGESKDPGSADTPKVSRR